VVLAACVAPAHARATAQTKVAVATLLINISLIGWNVERLEADLTEPIGSQAKIFSCIRVGPCQSRTTAICRKSPPVGTEIARCAFGATKVWQSAIHALTLRKA
jgi:hypothetical protein